MLLLLFARVGLVTSEFCEAREDVLVIALFCIRWANAAIPEGLPYAGALAELGDVHILLVPPL